MRPRHLLVVLAIALALPPGATAACAQGLWRPAAAAATVEPAADAPSAASTPLRGGLHLVRGVAATLVAARGPEGVLLVDADAAAGAERLDTVLRRARLGGVRRVVYTHHHREQVGGGDWFYRAGAEIVSSARARERLARRRDTTGRMDIPDALPDRVLQGPLRFRWGTNEVELRPVAPAHTDGDVIVFFRPANVVHVGDLWRGDGFPHVDLEGGGSVAGTIAVVAALVAEIDDRTIVVSSRGPLGDRRALREYLAMLQTVRARVLVQVRAGRTEQEVATSGLAGDFEPRWGTGGVPAERFLRQLQREVAALGR